MIIGIKLC